eukprot:201754-Karenia_brevis.AAC.1
MRVLTTDLSAGSKTHIIAPVQAIFGNVEHKQELRSTHQRAINQLHVQTEGSEGPRTSGA